MLTSLSSNVILAKARAMYGRRLKQQDYRNLLGCSSVAEVARYLKNQTDYAAVLAGINESEEHRGQLEMRLRQKCLEDAASLCRYELTVGEHFSDYLISRSEIEQVMHSLVLLQAGAPEEYLFSMPMFLNKHTHIDLTALSRVRSFDDLLDALSHTPYRRLLEPFRPIPGVPVNYTGIENALYTQLYRTVFSDIDRYSGGQAAAQLRRLFRYYIDMTNYVRIFRMRHRYREGADVTRSALLPFGSVRRAKLEELMSAENREEARRILRTIPSGRRFLATEYDYPDEAPAVFAMQECQHDIHFATSPSVVMLAYVFILQYELQDLTTIIEGVRYKLPAKETEKLLIANNLWKG